MVTDVIEDGCAPARARRSGGRANRVALRSAPLAENLRPVRAGMSGGQYRPLTPEGMERIHQAALRRWRRSGWPTRRNRASRS